MPLMPDAALEHAVAHGYRFVLTEILRHAAALVRGSIGVYVGGALLWAAILIFTSLLTLLIGLTDLVAGALGILATTPLTLGLAMVSARRAAGLPVSFSDLFAYRSHTAQGAIVLLINLLVTVAFDNLLGPGLALVPLIAYGLFTSLALYLVVDRSLGAWPALRYSARLVRHQWLGILALQVVLSLALILGALPLGVGLLWAFPWAMIALATVYVQAVGLRSAPAADALTFGGARAAPSTPDGERD